MARVTAALIILLATPTSTLRLPSSLINRRALVDSACLACCAALPAFAAENKAPDAKQLALELDRATPKEKRNVCPTIPAPEPSPPADGEAPSPPPPPLADPTCDPKEMMPNIKIDGRRGDGVKVVFTIPHENLGPPNHMDGGYTELMWLKNENTGEIITAKKFRPSDPNPVITGVVGSGTKVTAGSKCSLHGVWTGTFQAPS